MTEVLSDFTGEIKPKVVEVNGVQLTLKEFDMRTRALWMDVSSEYQIAERGHELQTQVIPKISGLSYDIDSDPRIKSAQKRLERLQDKHDSLLEVYATPEEPEDIDEQLEAIVVRMEEQADALREITERVQEEVGEQAGIAEKAVSEFMELQDKARIDFVWRIAKAVGKTELDFEEFYNRCDGGDYEAAERFVSEGNARWASLYANRMQQKPNRSKN